MSNFDTLAADLSAIMRGDKPVTLLGLSVSKETRVPDNEERGRALRSRLPSPTYNAHEWPHCQRAAYEREQCPPTPVPSYADRRGF